MTIKYLRVLIFALLVTSCASLNKLSVTDLKEIPEIQSDYILPKLNHKTSRNKGEHIAYSIKGNLHYGLVTRSKIAFKIDDNLKAIDSGVVFVRNLRLKNLKLYSCSSDDIYGISRNRDNVYRPYVIENNQIKLGTFISEFITSEYNYFNKEKKNIVHELIYTGKFKNQIKFTYREYSNPNETPDIVEEIQYDISENKIITYKEFSMKVINAEENFIKYIILNDFLK